MHGGFVITDLKYFMLDENGHLIFSSEQPPNGNLTYVHGSESDKGVEGVTITLT